MINDKDKWLKELEKWNDDLREKEEKESLKRQYRSWGKLGGRPKKYSKKKSKKILLSLTETQMNKLQNMSDSYQIKIQEIIRNLIDFQKPVDAERNKILMEYRTNFKRISNHFKSNIWSDFDKEKFKNELRLIIQLIEKELKIRK